MKVLLNNIRETATLGALLLLFSNIAYGQDTVGRWCDQLIPNMPKYNRVMSIVITDKGVAELRSDFNDGSGSVEELRERSSDKYESTEAQSGERYRIISENGDLQLIDEDGPIRTAQRLEEDAQPDECGS